MAWTLTKERGIRQAWRYIYETEVAAGAESAVLEIPGYSACSITLIPGAGGTMGLSFTTNKSGELPESAEFETDADMTGVSETTTETVFGNITAIKASAATAAGKARVLLR